MATYFRIDGFDADDLEPDRPDWFEREPIWVFHDVLLDAGFFRSHQLTDLAGLSVPGNLYEPLTINPLPADQSLLLNDTGQESGIAVSEALTADLMAQNQPGTTYYLVIEGLNGGVTDPEHKGAFEIEAVQLGAGNSVLNGFAGVPSFSELSVSLSGMLPDLFTALVAGARFESIQLQAVDANGSLLYDLLLGGAIVTGNTVSAVFEPATNLSFAFERVGLSTPDGGSFGYDLTANESIDPSQIPVPHAGNTGISDDAFVVQYYLTIDGYNGGTDSPDHKGAFEIDSLQFGGNTAVLLGGSNINVTDPSFSELTVSLEGIAPDLWAELFASDSINAVRIEGVDEDGDTVYDLRLEDVYLTSDTLGIDGGESYGSLSFDFQKIGLITSRGSFGYDLLSHKAITPANLDLPVPDGEDADISDPLPSTDYYLIITNDPNGNAGKGYIEIELSSVQFGAGSSVTFNGGGGERSPVDYSDVTVTFDGIFANIFSFLGSESSVGPVWIVGRNSDAKDPVVTELRLDDAYVTGNSISAEEGGGVSTSLSLDFGRIGLLTEAGSFGFDIANQMSLNPGSLPPAATPDQTGLSSYEGVTSYVLTIEGLNGGSMIGGAEGAFDISSLQFGGGAAAGFPAGSGAIVSPASFSEITVTLDGLSPALFDALANGDELGAIKIEGLDAKGASVYELRLEDAFITGNSTSGADGTPFSTSLSFAYGKIGIITADGGFGFNLDTRELVSPDALDEAMPGGTGDIEDGAVEQFYLLIDGLTGTSTDKGLEGWYEIDAASLGAGAAGAGGKASFSELNVQLGGALPELIAELAIGDGLEAVRLAGVDANGEIIYDLRLGGVDVTQNSIAGADGLLSTSLSFAYEQIGLITQGSEFGFDLSLQTSISPSSINPSVGGPPTEVPSLPTEYFLYIDGVEGNADAAGFKGWFDISNIQFGAGAFILDGNKGRPDFADISVALEELSPALFDALASGEEIPWARIVGLDAKGATVLDLRLGEVFVTESSFSSGGALSTSLSLNFDDFGLITPAVRFGYEISTHNEIDPLTIGLSGVAPVARDDAFGTDEDTALSGENLLDDNGSGADSDADGDTLTVTAVNGSGGNVGSQIILASGALLTVLSNGTMNYDPNGQFDTLAMGEVYTDSFAYTISDGNGGSDTATVMIDITGVNDAPADMTLTFTTDEDTRINDLDVLGLIGPDIDGEALIIVDVDQNGTAGWLALKSNGKFDYNPNRQFESLDPGEDAVDTFFVTVSDPHGATGVITVNIEISGLTDDPGETITGTDDPERFVGYIRADIISGEGGDDTLLGGIHDDTLDGGADDDRLQGQAGNDVILGGPGEDVINGGNGDDSIEGGSDDDFLNGNNGDDTVHGGLGADFFSGGSGVDLMFGEEGADRLFGNNGDDTLYGGDGEDFVSGVADNDELHGGANNDRMTGGAGNDLIYGDAGGDEINGDGGNDTVFGGDDDDRVFAGGGNDVVNGDSGNDTLFGNDGEDMLSGGADRDRLFGGSEADTLEGNDGDDRLDGQQGDDDLYGGLGRDLLYGSQGADVLVGGLGDDTLTGGSEDDLFYFSGITGVDTITDFVAGQGTEDVIELNGYGAGLDEFSELLAAASDDGTDTTIDLGNGNSLVLEGVLVADLHQDDFLFT